MGWFINFWCGRAINLILTTETLGLKATLIVNNLLEL